MKRLVSAGLCFLTAGAVYAQNGPAVQAAVPSPQAKSAAIPVVSHQQLPVIDGRPGEAAWQNGVALNGFVQRELHEGEGVSERTEVRVLSDGEALYVAAWLYDRDPGGIVPGEKIRDVSLENSDYVSLIFDTYHDRQNGFVFATTPAGIEYDGQVAKEGEGGGIQQGGQSRAVVAMMGGFNSNWNGTWQVKTSVDSLGWYAEFRIPFSTIRYAGGTTQTWGLNVGRGIRRKGEDAYWSFIPRQFNIYRLSRAGTIELTNVPAQRLGLFTPYVLGNAQRDYPADVRARRGAHTGFDVKYGITPGLTLDLTYNTDFAQVEVDEQRTNLTRFPLFFPEKRPFFLENAGSFSAGTPQSVDLFFSRRIGIDTLGHAVPIRGGGRVSGRVAGLTVGALEIVTDKVSGVQPMNSYTVARASREFSRRSRIGLIAVNRFALDSAVSHNLTYGIDSRIGLGEAWTVDAWGAKSSTPNRVGDDNAYSLRAGYADAHWSYSARVISTGSDFNPEVGFLTRTGGFRYYEALVQRYFRNANWPWLKDWNPHISLRNYYRPNGYYWSGWLHIDMTELEFADGGRLGPEYNIYHEGLQKPFTIDSNPTTARRVQIPVGDYTYGSLGLDWSTNPSAPLSLVLRGDLGPFYDGHRNGGNATVTFRRGASISTSLLVDYNNVRLTAGTFDRTLVGGRVAYFFTPRVFLQTLTQYSTQAQIWSANARFGWLSTAGTGLFIVYNDGENADGFFSWRQPQSRSLVIKYARQFGTGQ